MWTDSHCHLQDADDVPGVLAQAAEAGVGRLICIGTDLDHSRRALALALSGTGPALAPDVWASVGLHPHHASDKTASVAALLEALSGPERAKVVGVGECGLDYHYDYSPRPAQRLAFAEQIGLAHHYGLALIIHTRLAWDETFEILKSEGVPPRTVFHCFTGGPEEARRCLDLGAWLSFSGIVTFKSAPEVRQAAVLCPLDRLLVETDSPYLTPVPYRGQTNVPAHVGLVGHAVAQARGIDTEVVEAATWAGAETVFALATPPGAV